MKIDNEGDSFMETCVSNSPGFLVLLMVTENLILSFLCHVS
jgi:hypothetical protein